MRGYLRQDGRRGHSQPRRCCVSCRMRPACCRGDSGRLRDRGVQLIGFSRCTLGLRRCHAESPGDSLECGRCASHFSRLRELPWRRTGARRHRVRKTRRLLTIQQSGGTRSTIAAGTAWLESALDELEAVAIVYLAPNDLTIGLLPGKAGLETCRVLGQVTDRLLTEGATVILEDAAKGRDLSARGVSTEIELKLASLAQRAARYRRLFGEDSGSSGVSHQAAGMARLAGLLHPAEQPRRPGLYLLDNVPDSEPRHGPIDLGPAVAAPSLRPVGRSSWSPLPTMESLAARAWSRSSGSAPIPSGLLFPATKSTPQPRARRWMRSMAPAAAERPRRSALATATSLWRTRILRQRRRAGRERNVGPSPQRRSHRHSQPGSCHISRRSDASAGPGDDEAVAPGGGPR